MKGSVFGFVKHPKDFLPESLTPADIDDEDLKSFCYAANGETGLTHNGNYYYCKFDVNDKKVYLIKDRTRTSYNRVDLYIVKGDTVFYATARFRPENKPKVRPYRKGYVCYGGEEGYLGDKNMFYVCIPASAKEMLVKLRNPAMQLRKIEEVHLGRVEGFIGDVEETIR